MAPSLTKKDKETKQDREVVHEEPGCLVAVGENAVTADDAKEMLGWEETTGKEFLLFDRYKKKIICRNNDANRPFTETWAKTLGQSILNGHYRLNGETIVISRTGIVKSGQHRLIGLVLADQCWELGKALSGSLSVDWKKICPERPRIETFIAIGVDDSLETARTLDNVRPRSGADTLFAETSHYFKTYSQTDRKKLCRMAEFAVRLLWERTGAGRDSWAPKLTNSNLGDFIRRHPKILKAVEHIFGEYKEKEKLAKMMPPGSASCLLYLMGSGESDRKAYLSGEPRVEKDLDWSLWDLAESFWTELVGNSPKVTAIRDKLFPLEVPEDGIPLEYSFDEKLEVFALAWGCYRNGDKVAPKDLKLNYIEANGIRTLDKSETFGGIDLGDPRESEELDPEVTPEQLAERREEVRRGKHKEQAPEFVTEHNEDGDELVSVAPKKPAKKPKIVVGKKK